MFVSIYYKPSLLNAHTMILTVHIFMNVNQLCLNQESTSPLSSGTKQKIKGVASRHHQLCSVIAGQGRHYVSIVECSIRRTLRHRCAVWYQWGHYVTTVECLCSSVPCMVWNFNPGIEPGDAFQWVPSLILRIIPLISLHVAVARGFASLLEPQWMARWDWLLLSPSAASPVCLSDWPAWNADQITAPPPDCACSWAVYRWEGKSGGVENSPLCETQRMEKRG